jgi:hypothetical protein
MMTAYDRPTITGMSTKLVESACSALSAYCVTIVSLSIIMIVMCIGSTYTIISVVEKFVIHVFKRFKFVGK